MTSQKMPEIIETVAEKLDETIRPGIDLGAIIAQAEARVAANPPQKLIHQIEDDAVKAGTLLFEALASDEGAAKLGQSILNSLFGGK